MEGGLRLQGVQKSGTPGAPLFSVILPIKDPDLDELRRAMDSVLDQTWKNVELIVMDAASGPETVDVLRDYDDRIDYWRSAKDRGNYDAMNQAIDLAAGDWLYFLGADDVVVDMLHRLALRCQDRRTVYYGDVYMASRNRVYDGPFPWHKLRFKNVCHQAVFYPRTVFEKYRYQLQYNSCADYDLNIKLWADRSFKTQYLPELIAIYGVGESTFINDPVFDRDQAELVEAAFGDRIRRRERWHRIRHRLGLLLPAALKKRLGRHLPDKRRAAYNPPWQRHRPGEATSDATLADETA